MRSARNGNLLGWSLAVVALGLMGYQTLAIRENAGPEKPPLVAVVVVERVVNEINQYASDARRYQAIKSQMEDQIAAVESQMKQKAADSEAFPKNSERYQQAQQELLELAGEHEALIAWSNRRLVREEARSLEAIFNTIMDAARKIAVDKGYDIVLADDSTAGFLPNSTTQELMQQMSLKRILYTHPTLDITNDVIIRLNQ